MKSEFCFVWDFLGARFVLVRFWVFLVVAAVLFWGFLLLSVCLGACFGAEEKLGFFLGAFKETICDTFPPFQQSPSEWDRRI